ncbi:hypothetical protein GKZ89_06250 [Bacillus mangrovi]|uniref:Uncharacterized protein n=1 Tax=Metabacillus mangrovi TaxID=1491830 RepID=A0A7X2V3T2_9BACI|nr:hypothetical protein [Metabacillus mangrovi]MTH53007.1 hypothetical protein [Metabacillus mangrovi]
MNEKKEIRRLLQEIEQAEQSATEAIRAVNAMFDSDYPDSHATSSESIEKLKEQMDEKMILYRKKLILVKQLLNKAEGDGK